MADETTEAGHVTKESGQAFDPTKLQEMVQGAVRTSIESLVKEGQTRQAELDAAKATEDAQRKQAGEANALGDIFKPALEPALQAAKNAETRAALAADAADFYTAHAGDPVIAKYRGKIEEIVTTQLKRGNLVSRADAWKYLRGGDLYDELSKDTLTAHEVKIKEAQAAAAVGPSVTVPKFTKPIEQLNTEELADALKGVVF